MSSTRLPDWVKVDLPGKGQFFDLRRRMRHLGLHTVCEEARCPNIGQCWAGGTATLMILGKVCTRGCRFCDVTSGKPPALPDPNEPQHVVEVAKAMKLKYVVITSVDRDDLADQGSQHFVDVVGALKAYSPDLTIELLTPDFQGDPIPIQRVGRSGAEVLGHNLETVRALTPSIRDRRCGYDLSLNVLAQYRALGSERLVKSSLMLGLGETLDQVREALRDLRSVGVDWVTIGQYLRPTRKHAEVQSFVTPEAFEELADEARNMGFPMVTAGPLVRSSFRAGELGAQKLLRERARS